MKIQWEYDLVEKPFCQQLERLGWQWIEGDPDLPETTERTSSREVLLKSRLTTALRKLNLRAGQPWLDDARITRAIRDLEQAAGHRLIEVNQSATELLLKGTVADGLPDWDQNRPQPLRFIDFENPANNDFLVINQFKVELSSGRGHVIPDAVLFVNGIPLEVKIRADFMNKLRMFYETLNIIEHRPEVPVDVFQDAKLLGFINKVAANLYRDPALNLLGVAEKVKALIDAHVTARGVDPKIPPTAITDAEFEQVLQAQGSNRARATQMQHAARYHIIGFSNQNPAYARKMSEKLEEILRRFKDDWDALERELRKFIEELKQGDRNDFPDLEPQVQVPFVRLVLEECSTGRTLTEAQRTAALTVTLEMIERIRQEVRKVGFWKNQTMRDLLTRILVRDLDSAGICRPGTERDLAQRLVALAKEHHENLVRPVRP